jgi:hypothetical protein
MVSTESVFAEIFTFCKETVVVPASVAIFWFPMFVIWEGYDSIYDFAFVMNDDFLYSFNHSENPHNIHTISSVHSLDIDKVILYQYTYKIL